MADSKISNLSIYVSALSTDIIPIVDLTSGITKKITKSDFQSGLLLSSNNLSDVASASASRSNLGLAIGSNVQAWSSNLDAWSLITTASKLNSNGSIAMTGNLDLGGNNAINVNIVKVNNGGGLYNLANNANINLASDGHISYNGTGINATTVPYFDASKNLISSTVTPTELGYLSGVTSAIQTQLNAKVTGSGTSSGTNTGDQTITLTGESTGSGTGSFAVTLTNSAVIGKVLTGYASGAGTVAATDTILQAIQKLNGNASVIVSSQWITTGSDIYYSTGGVMIGTNSTASAKLHTVDTGTSSPRGVIADQYNTGTNSSQLNMRKARGTFASPTTIVTADILSNLNSWAYDGTNFINAAAIRTTSVGTIGTGRTPTKMEFYTMTDVTTGVLTVALTLDQLQNATFNSTGAVTLPVGTTAQQPTGVSGMARYNTDISRFEFYSGGWRNFVRLDGDTMTGDLGFASGKGIKDANGIYQLAFPTLTASAIQYLTVSNNIIPVYGTGVNIGVNNRPAGTTNGRGTDLIHSTGAGTGTGVNAYHIFKSNTSGGSSGTTDNTVDTRAHIGVVLPTSTTGGALWLGSATPTTSNYVLNCGSSTSLVLNCPSSGQMDFMQGGSMTARNNQGKWAFGPSATNSVKQTAGGTAVNPTLLIDNTTFAGFATAGKKAWAYDEGFGAFYTLGNGTDRVMVGRVDITNTTSTLGSEAGDLGFYTMTGGVTASLRFVVGVATTHYTIANTDVGLTIRGIGAAGSYTQTGDLLLWQSYDGTTPTTLGKITKDGFVRLPNGSQAGPSLSFNNSTGTGFYWNGTNVVFAHTLNNYILFGPGFTTFIGNIGPDATNSRVLADEASAAWLAVSTRNVTSDAALVCRTRDGQTSTFAATYRSGTCTSGNSGPVTLQSGAGSAGGNSGDVVVSSGACTNGGGSQIGNSGNIYIVPGTVTGAGFTGLRGNVALHTSSGSFGSGQLVLFVANATTVPSSNPTGGGILYVESGALKYRGSSGTITILGAA